MQVTITEALRIKNEVSTIVGQLQNGLGSVNYGKVVDGGKEVFYENTTFPTYLTQLNKILAISQEINDKLSKFNVESGISSLVRQKANCELLIRVYETAISSIRQPVSRRYEIVGAVRMEIETTFTPFLSKKDIKELIKSCKASIRKIQQDIDTHNAEKIDFSFEYSDVENLTTEQE